MSTIPIEVTISAEQLLQAIERLPAGELETFVTQVLTLRARREAGVLSKTESQLLLEINAGWPMPIQQRYDELVSRRELETITPSELQELIALTEDDEQRAVARLHALVELASLRGVTVPELLVSLDLGKLPHA